MSASSTERKKGFVENILDTLEDVWSQMKAEPPNKSPQPRPKSYLEMLVENGREMGLEGEKLERYLKEQMIRRYGPSGPIYVGEMSQEEHDWHVDNPEYASGGEWED